MFHIISDSDMNYLDLAEDQHKIDPSTKYIVITGNISTQNKRTMLYAETLAKMYPESKVIFNSGVLESDQSLYDVIYTGYDLHIHSFKKSPANLYYDRGVCVGDYDFFCTIGWPTFDNREDFAKSYIAKNLYKNRDEEFYIDNVLMSNKFVKFFSFEDTTEYAKKESEELAEWLKIDNGKQKVIVSSLGDQSKKYLGTGNFEIFKGVDLSGVVWICGLDHDIITNYRNGKLISLPGKDRTRYLSEEFLLIE